MHIKLFHPENIRPNKPGLSPLSKRKKLHYDRNIIQLRGNGPKRIGHIMKLKNGHIIIFSILIAACESFAFVHVRALISNHYNAAKFSSRETVRVFRSARPAVSTLILQSKQDSKPTSGFLDVFVGAISGVVSVTGATIDFRDASERESTPEVTSNTEVDISRFLPEKDLSLKVESIKKDLERLFNIISVDAVDPSNEEWMDLLENISCGLVSSVAEQPSNMGGEGNFSLPDTHVSALRFIGQLQEQIKASDPKLYSSFKWVAKKQGLSPIISKAIPRCCGL